jgi:hypothetical protein
MRKCERSQHQDAICEHQGITVGCRMERGGDDEEAISAVISINIVPFASSMVPLSMNSSAMVSELDNASSGTWLCAPLPAYPCDDDILPAMHATLPVVPRGRKQKGENRTPRQFPPVQSRHLILLISGAQRIVSRGARSGCRCRCRKR